MKFPAGMQTNERQHKINKNKFKCIQLKLLIYIQHYSLARIQVNCQVLQ